MVNGGYTDQKWRAECEEKWLDWQRKKADETFKKAVNGPIAHLTPEQQAQIEGNRKATNALRKANQTQIGGDHYKNMGVEPWDVVDTWPIEQRIGAYRAGALKYIMRCGNKDGRLQEIKKAGHYIEKLVEILQEEYTDADTGTT